MSATQSDSVTMVNFSHKREINEALITENDHECAICSCKERLRHTVAYFEDISSYARSLKLNKPFQRKEGVWALLRIAVIEETP